MAKHLIIADIGERGLSVKISHANQENPADMDVHKEVISILENYKETMCSIALLQYELDHPNYVTNDDVISCMNFAKNSGIGSHTIGHISDKTMTIAMHYQDEASKQNLISVQMVLEQLRPLEAKIERLHPCHW